MTAFRPSERPRAAEGRATTVVSILGAAAVAAYAVWGALQIIVLTPVAAVPGRSLEQIRNEMHAAGESPADLAPVIFLVLGVAIAVVVATILIRTRASAQLAVLLCLAVLVLGAPAFFIASFGPGMSLSDTFLISGGVTLPGVAPLYLVSAIAGVGCVALGVALASRRTPEAVTR